MRAPRASRCSRSICAGPSSRSSTPGSPSTVLTWSSATGRCTARAPTRRASTCGGSTSACGRCWRATAGVAAPGTGSPTARVRTPAGRCRVRAVLPRSRRCCNPRSSEELGLRTPSRRAGGTWLRQVGAMNRVDARRLRFDGHIAGVGTGEGTRVVVGRGRDSPWGPFADVMVEQRDGMRILLAPDAPVAEEVAATYVFDAVHVVPVVVALDRERRTWHVQAGPLDLTIWIGARTAVGEALRLVPAPLAGLP